MPISPLRRALDCRCFWASKVLPQKVPPLCRLQTAFLQRVCCCGAPCPNSYLFVGAPFLERNLPCIHSRRTCWLRQGKTSYSRTAHAAAILSPGSGDPPQHSAQPAAKNQNEHFALPSCAQELGKGPGSRLPPEVHSRWQAVRPISLAAGITTGELPNVGKVSRPLPQRKSSESQ